jgi:hypothetical protein
MTQYIKGDINSGYSNAFVVGGADPFFRPGSLTWSNQAVQIDPLGNVLTDLILAGKERVENGILYVYAIGHTGRLYKIQVNDPSGYNPDLDNPVLLATLTINSPTFTRGGFIDFFGSTERIYIGHDKGVTQIDFTGANETFVGVLGSWVQNVPRQLKQFIGKLYAGNGANIAEIDTTLTVTSYAKLTPGFPGNTQVRDMDVSIDGTYLNVVVSVLAQFDITSATQDTSSTSSSSSYIFKWNGTDTGYTSYISFPSFSLGVNIMFQNYEYNFGTDQYGMAVFDRYEKKITMQECQIPSSNAVMSTGNLVNWLIPDSFAGVLEADMFVYGAQDFEVGPGYWDIFFMNATGTETDINRVQCQIPVSNFGLGSSSNGYANALYGRAKTYFSTMETSAQPTTKYKFYKWFASASPYSNQGTPLMEAYYQTQTQMFSKKINVSEVRVYGEDWVDGNAFEIDLIGNSPNGTAVPGGTQLFSTADGSLQVGSNYAWFNPTMQPIYGIAVGILQKGTTNHVINRIELDVSDSGK